MTPEVGVILGAAIALGIIGLRRSMARLGPSAPREVCGDCGCCHPERRYEGDGDV